MLNNIIKLYDTDNSQFSPEGDYSIGYPQISLRTNRTPRRTDMYSVITRANNVAERYPDNKSERAQAVLSELSDIFGSGSFGHAWIIVFHSEEYGDYTTYSYHEGFGYVRNGDTNGSTNDSSTRGFAQQICMPITFEQIDFLEKKVIPKLNEQSTLIGNAFGMQPAPGRVGVYTPISNCAWFAGNVWNLVSEKKIAFTQDFNGMMYADKWGIDALALITEVSDPGMISESISGVKLYEFCAYDFQPGTSLIDYNIISNDATLYDGVLSIPDNGSIRIEKIDIVSYAVQVVLKEASGRIGIKTPANPNPKYLRGLGQDIDVSLELHGDSPIEFIEIFNPLPKNDVSFNGIIIRYWK